MHLSQPEIIEKALARQKIAGIPLAERNGRQDHFEAEQHNITALNQQIRQLEQQLEQVVCELFDLTPEEIELLEQNF
jgi:hypothetical protein